MIIFMPTCLLNRHRNAAKLSTFYKEVENTLHKTNDLIFLEEKETRKITVKLWMDYIDMTVTIKRMHADDPASFSLDKLEEELSDNTWLPIFLKKLDNFLERR